MRVGYPRQDRFNVVGSARNANSKGSMTINLNRSCNPDMRAMLPVLHAVLDLLPNFVPSGPKHGGSSLRLVLNNKYGELWSVPRL